MRCAPAAGPRVRPGARGHPAAVHPAATMATRSRCSACASRSSTCRATRPATSPISCRWRWPKPPRCCSAATRCSRRLRPPVRRHAGADAPTRWCAWRAAGRHPVCCTHEYTCRTCASPRGRARQCTRWPLHRAHCEALRADDRPTLPSTMAVEREINPFLRCDRSRRGRGRHRHGAARTRRGRGLCGTARMEEPLSDDPSPTPLPHRLTRRWSAGWPCMAGLRKLGACATGPSAAPAPAPW
jgi:hypothetical protein